jgi:2-polyprenyl-3-methyl-5-hydroxy-6-metoxy-1,4-benzoquinol methylase
MRTNMTEQTTKRLLQNRWGFYQYDPLPSEEELRIYYEQKYFQEGHGSYEISYTEEEISYFRLKAALVYKKTTQLISTVNGKRVIDIGCGEGWLMNEFHRHGCSVLGLDFSHHGLEKFHPNLNSYLEQGNLYSLLRRKIAKAQAFDVILCANVIEHVIDPVGLLQEMKSLMHSKSLLVIIAPNDFSSLHEYLLKEKKISKQFWLSYPDHLSYFNKDSMTTLLTDQGFTVRSVVADNPIDLNLLNDNSNYVEDTSKGKNTHRFRISTDNFLGRIDADKLLQIYEIIGSMGVGRNLHFYCTSNA